MSSSIKPVLGSQLKFGHPLANGLVDCWLNNENAPALGTIADLSLNNNVGTLVADTHSVGGIFGPALDFDGTGDYVTCGTIDITAWTQISAIAWVKTTDSEGRVLSIRHSGGDDIRIWIATGGSHVSLDDGTAFTTTLDNKVYDGTWHSIAFSFDGSEVIAYIDGIYESNNTGGSFDFNGADGLTEFGRVAGSDTGSLVGQIDHIIMWNRVLSASEFALLYREPFIMFERNPIELWVGATSVGVPAGAAGIMTPNTGYWGPTF